MKRSDLIKHNTFDLHCSKSIRSVLVKETADAAVTSVSKVLSLNSTLGLHSPAKPACIQSWSILRMTQPSAAMMLSTEREGSTMSAGAN